MGIDNMRNRISRSDIEKVREIRNPPEHEPGFEPDGDIDIQGDFSDIFGEDEFEFDNLSDGDFGSPNNNSTGGGQSLEDIFGGGSEGGFGSLGGTNQVPGQSVFGQPAFGQPAFGQPAFGQPAFGQPARPVEYKPDRFDAVLDKSGEAMMSIGQILIEMVKSINLRNADDLAYYNRNLILTGGMMTLMGIVVCIVGALADIGFIKISGFTGHIIACGVLTFGSGIIGLGVSVLRVVHAERSGFGEMSDLVEISKIDNEDNTNDYEDNIENILDNLLTDDALDGYLDDDNDDEDEEYNDKKDVFKPDFGSIEPERLDDKVDFSKVVSDIQENQLITRELLFDNFKNMFPIKTVEFADKKELYPNDLDFQTIETVCIKALANVAKCNIEDIETRLESAVETYFSYELRIERLKGVNKLDDIEREIEAYFRESSSDTSINATVNIEGDYYKIIVTKGVKAVVTFGDIFKHSYVSNFFLDNDNKLPIIVGVSELGEVILADAKHSDTMMISGKPRSGKSWYVLSIIMALMLFNSPELVQFILVDPKESVLFKTLGLMPHVCGVHNDDNILEVMKDIIDNESARRKKLLADNRCDDIWALWDKGIKLPVLYLVIDEVITVKNNLGPLNKDFDLLMQTIISQLPSQGIRLIFVPHRATGVINKTNRTMISFSAAVRANIDDIKDTLGVNKWTRQLVNQGDVAVKLGDREDGVYVRGGALTTSDSDNLEFITNAAKAFYKMGVDIPDMSTMRIAVNRNEGNIRNELISDGKRVQFNLEELLNVKDSFDDL